MLIVCATDPYYAELAGVMIRSVCANGNVPSAEIIVFADKLRPADKDAIALCADRPVHFIDVERVAKDRLTGLRTTRGWPRTTWIRLLVPDILASHSGRMLYLDCDTIVLDDLRPLMDLDLGGRPVAAFGSRSDVRFTDPVGLAPGSLYFNTGVIVVDLDAWRAKNIGERSLAWGLSNYAPFVDQDAINAVLKGDIAPIAARWNWHAKAGSNPDAAIVHFTGKKPNLAEMTSWAKGLFLDIRAGTPWGDRPLLTRRQVRLRRFWQNIKRLPRRILHPLRKT